MRVGQIAVCRRRGGGGGGGSAPAISASGLQIWNGTTGATSAAGIADPPQLIHVIPADAAEGDSLWLELDSATPPNPASGDYRLEQRILLWDGTLNSGAGGYALADPGTDAPHNFTIQTGLNPAKHWYGRNWIERNYGDATSSPVNKSAVADFTITAAGFTFAWNPANLSTWDPTHQTLSNSNRTWLATTAASGANSSIRSTLNISGNGTKVYFEFNPDVWDAAGSAGLLGVATDTYGGAGSPGSLASVGDALANLNQTAGLIGSGADLYVANAYVATPAGVDIAPANHAIGFAIRVNASDMTLWVLKDGVCGHGDPVAGTGGYTLPFTQVRPIAALNPNGGTNQGVTINTLAAATTRAPSGFTPAGA
jgi:hypothetical protein